MFKKTLYLFLCLSSILIQSQTKITGTVFDEYLEPFPGAIIYSSDGNSTTSTYEGTFSLDIKKLPVTITASSVGYTPEKIEITEVSNLNIILKEAYALNQIVMSASRTPERILESPVSIERMSTKDFKNYTAVNFYENIENLKGIDVLSNSFNIKNIVSNRGFANTENTRFVQIVDGTETTLPFINYSLGNQFGLNELDIESLEVLPGAASALYGPNALNGILLMNSKNPFDDQGISSYMKYGITDQEERGSADFYDIGIRIAHKFNDKFAAKANFTYNKGEEWHALDNRNTTEQGGEIIEGTRETDPGYDGLNVYGDETNINLINLFITGEDLTTIIPSLGIAPGTTQAIYSIPGSDREVSREGYREVDLIDNQTKSLLFDASLYYRPWGNKDLEIILSSKYNLADNIIHGSNRYTQKDGLAQQHRIEFKGINFFLRGYYTQNNANLVDPRLTAFYLNEDFKSVTEYFGDYANALISNGFDFNAARITAETGKAQPGSAEFDRLVKEANSLSINEGGASLKDRSGFYHIDGNYNFRDLIDFAEIQVGGSYRKFLLNSNGQIYTDAIDDITFNEYGFYTQLQKKILDERLNVTLTGRYDKSTNFSGNFSPRASIAYSIGERKDHNIRVSYQTGFRNPTTQDQYASINLGDRLVLGSVEDNLKRESTEYDTRSVLGIQTVGESTSLTGINDVKNNSYTLASVERFLQATRADIGTNTSGPNIATAADQAARNSINLLEKAEFDFVKPETVKTIELGYRGTTKLADNLFDFDVAGYYNIYENFITQRAIWTPLYGDVDLTGDVLAAKAVLFSDVRRYIIRTNTNAKVKSYGFTAGFNTKILDNFNIGASYAFADYNDDGKDDEFKAAYNTPKHKVKISFGNEKLFKNFGFNINARWQDWFRYESVFINDIINARTVIDAQVNYSVPSIKSTFKIGGTNIGGENYTSVPGTGSIGSQYYISWVINN